MIGLVILLIAFNAHVGAGNGIRTARGRTA